MKNYPKKNFKKLEQALKIINTGKLITRFMTRYYNQPPGKVKSSHKNLWGWEPVLIGNKETLVGNLRECLKKDKSKKKYYDEAVKCDCVKVMSLKKFSRKKRTIDPETLKLGKMIDKYLLRIGYGKDTNLGQHRVMLMDMSYNFKDGTNIYQVMRDCGFGVFFNGIQSFTHDNGVDTSTNKHCVAATNSQFVTKKNRKKITDWCRMNCNRPNPFCPGSHCDQKCLTSAETEGNEKCDSEKVTVPVSDKSNIACRFKEDPCVKNGYDKCTNFKILNTDRRDGGRLGDGATYIGGKAYYACKAGNCWAQTYKNGESKGAGICMKPVA